MTPEVRQALSLELDGDEGNRLKVYDDATGKPIGPGTIVKGWPTIGRGRNLVARGISHQESDSMLAADITACETDLAPLLPWLTSLTPKRQVVVYSLYFNTGLGSPQHFVSKGWPQLLGLLEGGEFELAAVHLEKAEPWASQVGPRANRLANFLRFG